LTLCRPPWLQARPFQRELAALKSAQLRTRYVRSLGLRRPHPARGWHSYWHSYWHS
jgi:hypothetical protein